MQKRWRWKFMGAFIQNQDQLTYSMNGKVLVILSHPDCTKSSIDNMVTRLAMYEQRTGTKRKRWFMKREESEKLNLKPEKLQLLEDTKLEAYTLEKQAEDAKRQS